MVHVILNVWVIYTSVVSNCTQCMGHSYTSVVSKLFSMYGVIYWFVYPFADTDVRELAQELADILRKCVGTTKYLEAFSAVQQMVYIHVSYLLIVYVFIYMYRRVLLIVYVYIYICSFAKCRAFAPFHQCIHDRYIYFFFNRWLICGQNGANDALLKRWWTLKSAKKNVSSQI